jgi:hypothetical protein
VCGSVQRGTLSKNTHNIAHPHPLPRTLFPAQPSAAILHAATPRSYPSASLLNRTQEGAVMCVVLVVLLKA